MDDTRNIFARKHEGRIRKLRAGLADPAWGPGSVRRPCPDDESTSATSRQSTKCRWRAADEATAS